MIKLKKYYPKLVLRVCFLFAFTATFTFLVLRLPKDSQAASLANFRPGNIISDYTMSDYNSMTIEEIDAFLHTHGNCNDTETYRAEWYPTVHYHIKDGHYVCLADEVFAEGIEYGDLIPEGTPYRTAAQVIYDTAQEFRINPQVLIVLLEKEQGLISDSWPNSLQYRSATGYGCPDTAPCNELYYGFVNQLDNAAHLFRTVLDGGWTNYPLGDNFIYYNPNRSCGGSNVFIENLATSSLYRYTPYQPNEAALAAGYGTVTCGAYGNRNFYLFFMDWFGDPTYIPEEHKEEPEETQDETAPEEETAGDQEPEETEKVIEAKIEQVYSTHKNELGDKIGSLNKNENTGIYYQDYEHGCIVGNDKYGYYESRGKIREVWQKQGFEFGNLGFPLTDIQSSSSGIYYQEYQGGFIVGRDKTGYYISTGKIREVWQRLGFEFGNLGFPTSNIKENPNTGIYYQDYEHGCIVGNDKYGYYESRGKIREVWQKQGFEFGSLGFPLSDINDDGCQVYQGGTVCEH